MFDDDAAEVTAHLRRWYDLPSPGPRRLDEVTTNAVLIDRAGRVHPVNLPTGGDVFTVRWPIRRPFDCGIGEPGPPTSALFPVAEFQLSSVVDGVRVYRQTSSDR